MAPVEHLSDTAKHIGDGGALFVTLGALFNILPSIASLLSVIWLVMRIYESWLNIKAKRRGND